MLKRLLTAVLLMFCLHTADAADRPNILFVIADDWSFGHAGAYGCDWVQTPNFDRIAAQGVLFTHAYTPNAKCAPSRSIILTGRHSWQLEAAANHVCYYPEKYGSFMQRLEAAGYTSASTGKGWGPGVDPSKTLTGEHVAKRGNDYADNFGLFLEQAPKDRPWVFWLGTYEPHRGYKLGSGIAKGKKVQDIDRVPGYWPDTEAVRSDMLDYAVEVETVDTQVGKAMAALDAAGQLDNTLIVVTSDHGMPFPRVKGQAYHESNHVPMAVRWPKGIRKPGRVVDDYVSFIDLAPTFLEVAGVDQPGPIMQPITGRSLVPLLTSELEGRIDPTRDHVLVGKERHDIGRPHDWGYPIRGINKDGLLYLHNDEPGRWPSGNPETGYLNCDSSPTKTAILELRRAGKDRAYWELCFDKRPAEELYDLKDDPDCLHNLADAPAFAERKAALKAQLHEALLAQQDPRALGHGEVFEQYPYANEGHRDFYDKWKAGHAPRTNWAKPDDYEKQPVQ